MKRCLLFAGILCALILSNSVSPASSAAGITRLQRAQINFAHPVELMGVTLKGDYLFVHDDQAMTRGEACTFVYKGLNEDPKNLVATFHCVPAARDEVGHFTVRTSMNEMGQLEITEYQFAGSPEAHLVPTHQHYAYVPLVSTN
jgi:hypothetical protein